MNQALEYRRPETEEYEATNESVERVQWGERLVAAPEKPMRNLLDVNPALKRSAAAMALLALGSFAFQKEAHAQGIIESVPVASSTSLRRLEKGAQEINFSGRFTSEQKEYIRTKLKAAFAANNETGVDIRFGAEYGWERAQENKDVRITAPAQRQGRRNLLTDIVDVLSAGGRTGSLSEAESKVSMTVRVYVAGIKNKRIVGESSQTLTLSASDRAAIGRQQTSRTFMTQGRVEAAFQRAADTAINDMAKTLLEEQVPGKDSGFVKSLASATPNETGSGFTSGTLLGSAMGEIPPAPQAPERREVAASAKDQATLEDISLMPPIISGKIVITDTEYLEKIDKALDTSKQLTLQVPIEYVDATGKVLSSTTLYVKCAPGSLVGDKVEISFSTKSSKVAGSTTVRLSGKTKLYTTGPRHK